MANAKISDDSVFDPKTNVRLISGLAGYDSSGNAKISGQNLVESVINSNNSGTPSTATDSRVAFYGANGDNLGGSGGFIWQNNTYTLNIGAGGMASGLDGGLVISGNYIAGNDQPKVTFKFGDTTNNPEEFIITTSSSGVGQTLILPSTIPSTGQYLKVNGVFNTDNIALGWDNPITGSGTNLKLPIFNGTEELGDSAIFQDSTGADPTITLFSSDVQIKEKLSHQESPADTFIGFTAEGKFEVTTDGTQAILCGTSGEVELKKTGVTVAQTIDHALALTGNGTQFAGRTRYWDYDNDRYVDIIGPNNLGAVSYGLILPNTPPGDGTTPVNKILESDTNGALSWINTPAPLSPGGSNQAVQYQTSTGTFGGDSGFTYQLQTPTVGDTRNRLSLGDVGSTKGEVNLYGGATESGFIGLFAPTDEGVTITVPTAPNDSYTVTLPGDTPANNQILQSNSSGVLSWIDTPSSGGGGGGYQTLTGGSTVSWNAANGLNAKLEPTSTAVPNAITATGFTAGDSGSLLIVPTNTPRFTLPTNSKASFGFVDASSVRPTVFEYFYDGSNFYWYVEENMLDPIYFPVLSTTGLVSLYVPATYTGAAGNVPTGGTWPNSNTGNSLIGDLARFGTDLDDLQFVPRNDETFTPAHWIMGADGSSTGYWNRNTLATSNAFGASWSGIVWLQTNSTTSTSSYHGIMDGDKDDDEAMYMDDRRLCLYGINTGSSYVYNNFPALIGAGLAGNSNTFSLQDVWVYFGISLDASNNGITFYIGCQETLNNAGGTIKGFNGQDISIPANGLYKESVQGTISEGTWNDFQLGSAGGSFTYEGLMGMAAVYSVAATDAQHETAWENTYTLYYLTP